jgi:hypothetical protein
MSTNLQPEPKVCGRERCPKCAKKIFETCQLCGFVGCKTYWFDICVSCSDTFCNKCLIMCDRCDSKLCKKERTNEYQCWNCDFAVLKRKPRDPVE